MADIAAHLGVPRSSLYYHFGDKGDLLTEILLLDSEDAYQRVSDIADFPIDARERLMLAIRTLLIRNVENPSANVASLYHVDSPLLTTEQRQKIVNSRDRIDHVFRRILEEGIEVGQFKRLHAVVVSNAILTAVGRFQSWFRPDGDLSIDEVVSEYIELFLQGVTQQESGPTP